jgi:hypothetical protein
VGLEPVVKFAGDRSSQRTLIEHAGLRTKPPAGAAFTICVGPELGRVRGRPHPPVAQITSGSLRLVRCAVPRAVIPFAVIHLPPSAER